MRKLEQRRDSIKSSDLIKEITKKDFKTDKSVSHGVYINFRGKQEHKNIERRII